MENNSLRLYLMGSIGLLLALSSCAVTPVRVDPTVLYSSVDFTKPAEIAEQSKPVWVLPMINKGWNPARVDPKSGDWISGYYSASVIQEGHWATLEEAELAGRPYIVAGEGKPVVPLAHKDWPSDVLGVREVPPTGNDHGEIDLVSMKSRLAALEQQQSSARAMALPEKGKATESVAEQQSFSPESPPDPPRIERTNRTKTDLTSKPAGVAPSQLSIESGPIEPSTGSKLEYGLSAPVIIPGHSAARDYEIPLGLPVEVRHQDNPPPRIQVHYLPDNEVQIIYKGRSYQVHLTNPEDKIKITLPGS